MNASEHTDKAYGLESFHQLVSRKADAGFFDRGRPVLVTRAPGRLDLMGGIADYSGSLVLQYPIREATFVAVQPAEDNAVRIESIADAVNLRSIAFSVDANALAPPGNLGTTATARRYFSENPKHRWAAYVAGAFPVLAETVNLDLEHGVRILIHSEVPPGKGVSSSAALEVSAMTALLGLGAAPDDLTVPGRGLSSRELALLCQRVENEVVGAPCGVMDQMVSACGPAGHLIELLCQPAELLGSIELPKDIGIWGIDSGIRHSVAAAGYGTVRTAASMGYRIIAEIAGFSIQNAGPGRVTIADGKWDGYLANIDPEMFGGTFASELPDSVNGREFVATFYGVSDPFAAIDPNALYPVRAATSHPVYENARVKRFRKLLLADPPDLEELGSLMYGSHESYSMCGLGSDGTDRLVEMVKNAGQSSGLFGAKITGGGSGGTVAVLGRRGSDAAVKDIAAKYEALTGRRMQIFSDSSPGACLFGRRILNL